MGPRVGHSSAGFTHYLVPQPQSHIEVNYISWCHVSVIRRPDFHTILYHSLRVIEDYYRMWSHKRCGEDNVFSSCEMYRGDCIWPISSAT